MSLFRLVLIATLALGASALGLRGRSSVKLQSSANPIRRVVSMLQNMQKKITEEGERDQELYDKFMCYCKTSGGDLAESIKVAETKSPALTSSIQESTAEQEQLKADLATSQQERADAKTAVQEATALREKEATTYAKDSGDMKTNIAALGKAIDLISHGASGGAFLQTTAGATLRNLVVDMELSAADRDIITSFLSEGSSNADGYAPQSGQIVGILKEMKDTMEKELAELTKSEESNKATFEELVAAKTKEIAANSQAIEDYTGRLGKVGVKIVELKEELEDVSKTYAEDKKFLEDLEKNCGTKEQDFESVKKTRAEEVLALAETIKILNDDDSLELFKSTLKSPSLLQVKQQAFEVRSKALKALHQGKSKDPRVEMVLLALRGKKVNFDKVLKMVDDMVVLLGQEQGNDDEKKAYCEEKIDATEDQSKILDREISMLDKTIEETKAFIETTTEEIEALISGVKALDKSVAQATANRKEENEEFKKVMAEDTAAKKLLGVAKNRLNQFYNPKLYVAPPKQELSEEDQIAVNLGGGTPPPTEAPGGIAGTGVEVFVQVSAHTQRSSGNAAPPPPPETFEPYTKKGQESSGVLTLIDMLIADLDKEMQEMEVEEKDSQKDYEGFMGDSAEKRALDTQSISDKESAKADSQAALVAAEEEKTSKVHEGFATAETLKDLHKECDWLLSNFDARKAARAGEVDSLKKAKAILSGADYE